MSFLLQAELNNQSYVIENLKRQSHALEKQIASTAKDRDVAQKNFVQATGATQKQIVVAKVSEQQNKTLEQELNAYKEEAGKMRKLILALEKDRDHLMLDKNKGENHVKELEEVINALHLGEFDSKKKIIDLEKKLKEQQVICFVACVIRFSFYKIFSTF